jgi:hypothetical protein
MSICTHIASTHSSTGNCVCSPHVDLIVATIASACNTSALQLPSNNRYTANCSSTHTYAHRFHVYSIMHIVRSQHSQHCVTDGAQQRFADGVTQQSALVQPVATPILTAVCRPATCTYQRVTIRHVLHWCRNGRSITTC